MTLYNIFEVYDPSETPIAALEADTDRDALAEYAIRQGFADPREPGDWFVDAGDWFYDRADGSVGMIFTNTELSAKEAV